MMTLEQFLALQQELFNAFGWIIRWWLILFTVAGVISSTLVAILVTTRQMIEKS